MKKGNIISVLLLLFVGSMHLGFAQTEKAQEFSYQANELSLDSEYSKAEALYRKAYAVDENETRALYNLGTNLYKNELAEEAFSNFKTTVEKSTFKEEKHNAYHNMGNLFMDKKEYEKAVEAYKNALRQDPTDDETRYNLALAKEMLKKNPPQNNKDQDDKDEKDDKQQDQKDQQNQEGDSDSEKEKQEENKNDSGDGDSEENKNEEGGDEKQEQKEQPQQGDDSKKEQSQNQPRPNQLSKQQIENLLEAMRNEEKKVQEKLKAAKVKGKKIKTDKDW